MKTIYFIGGAKGTGKSTIIKAFSEKTQLKILNTGSYFKKNLGSPKETKYKIIDDLIRNSPIIADTHYSVGIRRGKIQRGLNKSELEKLSKNSNLKLILIDINLETLIQRIERDKRKIRNQDIDKIYLDLEYNRKYFEEYSKQLGIAGHLIRNYDFYHTFNSLMKIWQREQGIDLKVME